jgi:hypothetical protein
MRKKRRAGEIKKNLHRLRFGHLGAGNCGPILDPVQHCFGFFEISLFF